ncbi:hypothetical protein ACH3VR_20115 [Microbacterium sp. B2969]|uniref:Uncharacterized protein n=1 Tax=Microbacterium alkaliflavum TaxID=3248839 RepID=A0ABW7QCS0_9MICO
MAWNDQRIRGAHRLERRMIVRGDGRGSVRRPFIGVAVVTLLACLGGLASPARAASPGDDPFEPPGLDGRDTHVTLLTTHESDCTELAVVRAVTPAGARELVPPRYEPLVLVGGGLTTGRFAMWDYVCEQFSIDGQTNAPRTQISMGGIAVTTRDGERVDGAYYLVYLATDNPVLAARYRQVGLPATFTPGLSATVSDTAASPFEVSFDAPTARYAVAATAPAAPVVVPATSGLELYFEGGSGGVLLSYENKAGGSVAAQLTADYREHSILAPIIALPRLLQPVGAPFPIVRGDWDATAARQD